MRSCRSSVLLLAATADSAHFRNRCAAAWSHYRPVRSEQIVERERGCLYRCWRVHREFAHKQNGLMLRENGGVSAASGLREREELSALIDHSTAPRPQHRALIRFRSL